MRCRHELLLLIGLVATPVIAMAQPQGGAPAPPPAEDRLPEESEQPPPESERPSPPLEQVPPPSDPPSERVTVPPAVEPSKPPGNETPPDPVVTGSPDRGFRFGSYGRVLAGTDLRGGKPESANVVSHGPRIVEPSYLELDLSYGFVSPQGMLLRPVITLAFDGTLFHDTGDFDAQPALRNVYLDAQVTKTLTAWVGSRMYRGDNIYLFDWWPLDEQNTVGGGLYFRKAERQDGGGDAIELGVHAGVNRLNRDFTFQEIDVANPEQGATTITQLNRQRMVASATAAYILAGNPEGLSLKLKIHSEVHALPDGTRRRDDGTFEDLPSDTGFLVGAQIAAFGFAAPESGFRRHLNLFGRYAKGLAAFDELAVPTSFGRDLKVDRASELTFAVGGNWDASFGNLNIGVLSRRFIDADGSDDRDDGWEYALDARPLAKIPGTPSLFAGADVSYQARFPRGLNPNTQRAEDPAVFQLAPMLVYSPMGPSAYDRPQLRLVYRAAHFNQAALDAFVPDDPRRAHEWTHFLGFQAEWWFNSSSYR